MSPCPPTHEGWKELWLTEGAATLPAASRAELEACPQCSVELAELERLSAALERGAHDQRADLAEALARNGSREEAFVRSTLAARVPRPRTRAAQRRALVAVLALAAAVVFVLFVTRRAEDGPRAPDVLLDSTGIQALLPSPGAFGALQWSDPTAPEYGYLVEAWTESALLDSLETTTTRAIFPPDSVASWPDEIEYRVYELDLNGRKSPGAARARAQR
jgi:hypothetical protein